MRNVAPSRALSRRSNQLLTIAFFVGAVGVFVSAVGILLFVVRFAAPTSENFGTYLFIRSAVLALGIVIFLIAVGLAVRALTWKKDNDLAVITGRVLEPQLDDRYMLIRNVSKREIGYVDAVLVGPPGVLVFRILNKRGVFANEGPNWMTRGQRGEWLPAGINPTREAIADINKVRQFLAKKQINNPPIYGVVVFTTEPPYTQLMAKEPTVPITHLPSLYTNLQGNYLASERIDAPTTAAIARHLLGE